MSQIPARSPRQARRLRESLKARDGEQYVCLTPDFPFDYREFLTRGGGAPLGTIRSENHGKRVAIVGGGVAGLITAYEIMRMGLVPVIFEASDRLGGRFLTERFEENTAADMPIAEMGAMRFSQYSRTVNHYFEKTGMLANSTPFPNPGSGWVPGNIVDYKGSQSYYVVDPLTGEITDGANPLEYLSEKFYGTGTPDSGLMESNGLRLSEVWGYQTAPGPDEPIPETQKRGLKDHWNALLNGIGTAKSESMDIKSFRDLMTDAGWSFDDIEAFGQVGFGTGGWGTDYIHSAMEILRVIYMALDTDQFLMLDGTDTLTSKLYSTSPAAFGDSVADGVSVNITLEQIQAREHLFDDGSPLLKEVVGFFKNSAGSANEIINIYYRNSPGGQVRRWPFPFEAVVYTPHVRVLDKLRYQSPTLQMQKDTTDLFDPKTWEAIMYTHFQQSVKVFQVVDNPFWNNLDQETGQYEMSQTLSDRITRGTYLVDYAKSTAAGGNLGAGVFTSYTWQDDSMKFIETDNAVAETSWITMTTKCLNQIYDSDDVFRGHADGQPSTTKKWDDAPHYICAFKYNLPGQYTYQRILFQNFYCGPLDAANVSPDTNRFILAGDNISWTAAWAEGAAQTALNAVSKLEYLFNGNERNPLSPHGQYEMWMPIDAPVDPGR